MFGGGTGPWKDTWKGWWGDNHPFHLFCFILTHYERPMLEMDGGTIFPFVTDGIEKALDLARKTSNGKDIVISGGATVAKQYILAELITELDISLVPVFLEEGVKLFDSEILSSVKLEQVRVVEAPGVVHLKYRIIK